MIQHDYREDAMTGKSTYADPAPKIKLGFASFSVSPPLLGDQSGIIGSYKIAFQAIVRLELCIFIKKQ